jgi:pimeloyl-CoA dehydrogenase large subunit
MDLNYSPEELAFRDSVRAWLRQNLPGDLRDKVAAYSELSRDDLLRWHRILAKQGWVAPSWPKEWGGTDWDVVQRYIFEEECGYAGAPPLIPFGLTMCAAVLLKFGTPAQKKHFLPRIYDGEDFWCQGYSEPGSGSDLASLKTRATRQGEHYVVNGQKTWTTLAHYADWIFCLVRTDSVEKKQEGISFLLIDMKTPGITVRPLILMDGGQEVNEVFFDDVVVPAENLVGQMNRGWDCAKFLLGNERTGIARVGTSKARLKRIRELAALERVGEGALIADKRFREKLAAVEIELKALEMTQLRIVADERRREKGKPNPASSILKLKGSVIQQATTELMMEVAGPFAMPYVEQDRAEGRNEPGIGPDFAAGAAPTYFNWRKISIYGGSNEIQRNIVAKAILGF